MPDKPLKEVLVELDSALRTANIQADDRKLIESVHQDVSLALTQQPSAAVPAHLPDSLRRAIERVQVEHPRLSSALTNALNALSEIGL
jgi:hypothetical protein